MTEVEVERSSRYDEIDVETILARCERRSPFSFSRKRTLYQAPEFITRLPATETVEEGATITFGCKVLGFPKPKVTWYKDDDVINSKSRASIGSEDSGVHSIKIADISKCDAGTYKVQASNLEGSSSSSLFITVKAKSKLRNKKKHKRKGKTVACAPLFPAIIELVAEETLETRQFELQPESPLTPIYCTISRKSPVIWPVFLGEWAYNHEEMLHKCDLEDVEMGSEDVFDSETEVQDAFERIHVEPSSKDYKTNATTTRTSICNSCQKAVEGLKDEHISSSREPTDSCSCDMREGTTQNSPSKRPQELSLNGHSYSADKTYGHNESRLNDGVSDTNDKKITSTNGYTQKAESDSFPGDNYNDNNNSTSFCHEERKNNTSMDGINGHVLNKGNCDGPETISVNRSYAKGSSTFSVAKRSPSPYSSRKLITYPRGENSQSHGIHFRNRACGNVTDASTLQNITNEHILNRMQRNCSLCHNLWNYFSKRTKSATLEDNLLELLFVLCGATFLALYLELCPSTFVMCLLIAIVIYSGLLCILKNA